MKFNYQYLIIALQVNNITLSIYIQG